MQEGLNAALAITRKMYDAMQKGDFDGVEQLAVKRDEILHHSFSGEGTPEDENQEVSIIVEKIVALNNEMIEMGEKEKANIKSDMEREIRGSSHIQKYIDNMP
jgi:hypothetical protein